MSEAVWDQSIAYRKRAAEVGRIALHTSDPDKMLRLLHQALSWIQLAENEEALMQARIEPTDRPN